MIFFNSYILSANQKFIWGFFADPQDSQDPELFHQELNQHFSVPLMYAHTQQVHHHHIEIIQKSGIYNNTDGLVSSTPNLVLSIHTADCLPIVAFNPHNQIFGIAHAGWKGTKEKIILELYNNLHVKEGETILLDFLPHICENCYEVGEEFKDFFPEMLIKKQEKYYLSLLQENKRQLEMNHVPYELFPMINNLDLTYHHLCTLENTQLPSYRRKSMGRMFSFCFLLSPAP